jgi:hypothetical protein
MTILPPTIPGLLLGFLAAVGPQANPPSAERGIEIRGERIAAFEPAHPDRERFGGLLFRGGLVLTSPDKAFGGISSLRLEADGEHFVACSDRALWLRGRILYKDGRPAGIAEASLSPVLNGEGRPARDWDVESLAGDGRSLWIGLERLNLIVRFDYGGRGVLARGRPIAVPPELKDLPFNRGLEGLVFVPEGRPLEGALIALAERSLTKSGDHRAFLIGGPSPGAFAVERTGGFDISDAAFLPPGDLVILERFFTMSKGLAVRLRRLSLAEIKPGALVDGPILFQADMAFQIDNFEALAIHRTTSGETRLTLVSDDNFSPLQRTLLLQFALAPDDRPADPGPRAGRSNGRCGGVTFPRTGSILERDPMRSAFRWIGGET